MRDVNGEEEELIGSNRIGKSEMGARKAMGKLLAEIRARSLGEQSINDSGSLSGRSAPSGPKFFHHRPTTPTSTSYIANLVSTNISSAHPLLFLVYHPFLAW